MLIKILSLSILLGMIIGCSSAPTKFEMEQMSDDVIKSKRGVDIRIMPIEEDKKN